ncbi:MAG: hypothetical protein PVSMB7_26850 [Chloroflexota bacterium]
MRYTYVRSANVYARSMGGSPHVDANSGKVISPSNVIVMQTKNASADPNAGPITPGSILIPTLGRGTAWFFRNGKAQKGVWQQQNVNAPLLFFDAHGAQIALNPGQTWIEAVPSTSSVTWQFR